MKKLCGLIFAVSLFVQVVALPLEELDSAIAQSRLGRVKSLLHRIAREESLSDQARIKLLGNLYDSAAELTDKRIEGLSLIRSWKDMGKVLVGTTTFIAGLASLAAGVAFSTSHDRRISDASWYGKIASGFLIPGGAYMFYRGFTCADQKAMILKATEVEEYIDTVLNATELLDSDEIPHIT